MDYLPENVRRAYELYINGSKKEAFEALVPGSEYHSYLSIIDSFKTNKGKIDSKTKDMITRFKKNWPGFDAERVELQSLFLSFDHVKSAKDKDEIIKEIEKNFIHGYYEYSKPAEIKGVKDKRVRDRSKSPSRKKVNNVFVQEKYFDLGKSLFILVS